MLNKSASLSTQDHVFNHVVAIDFMVDQDTSWLCGRDTS